MDGTDKNKRKLVITRIFDAPVEDVWRAWTDSEYSKRWWGPKGYTSPMASIDARAGGKYLVSMKSPEGNEIWSTGVYEEVIPYEKIVCTDSFSDSEGNVVQASYYGMSSDFPMELKITVRFNREDGKTKMTLEHEGFPPGEMKGAEAGWNESFDKLEESLKK